MDVQGVKCGMIADFLTEDTARGWEAGNLLMSTVIKSFEEERVGLSGCLMLQGTTEFRLLRKRGYFICPSRLEPQPFPVVRRMHQAIPSSLFSKLDNWFFTMGDYDVV